MALHPQQTGIVVGGAKICAQLLRGNSAWLNKTPS
ncbi:hypothetical protein T4E_11693 [Trichinella pseudospiralis]|uniref:Uncharacterized protein n=1 Tax=Trichinella pseudospiralis TaxID=6337 RepID=A0A0V0WGC6_TRIPS|nr:hypothetical protein T4E_11693 [Trichinella pseudospiralis]